jgi:two-component system nitrate/nitrite response regulator NarL
MSCIVVVDDHELLAEALCIALRAEGQEAVRVLPQDHDSLIAEVLAHTPAVVLLDLDLGPHGESTPVVGRLSDAGIRVVLVTGVVDRVRVAAGLEAGAITYRSKAAGFPELLAVARAARAADAPLDPDERVTLLGELHRSRVETARRMAPFRLLTDREQATLRAVADGSSVQEIAADWVVSEATVRSHVRGLLGKLDVRSQVAAVATAWRSGWLTESHDPAA